MRQRFRCDHLRHSFKSEKLRPPANTWCSMHTKQALVWTQSHGVDASPHELQRAATTAWLSFYFPLNKQAQNKKTENTRDKKDSDRAPDCSPAETGEADTWLRTLWHTDLTALRILWSFFSYRYRMLYLASRKNIKVFRLKNSKIGQCESSQSIWLWMPYAGRGLIRTRKL